MTKVLARVVIKHLAIAKVVLGALVWARHINICLAAPEVITEEAKVVNGVNRVLEIMETLAMDMEVIRANCSTVFQYESLTFI